jgi:hypothetical protein
MRVKSNAVGGPRSTFGADVMIYCMAGVAPRSRQVIKVAGEAIREALADLEYCRACKPW